jgi:hypothetical protein
VLAARGDVPGVSLVLVETVERKRSQQVWVQLVGQWSDAWLCCGHRLDMRELFSFEQIVPGDGAGRRHSSAASK